MGWGLQDFFGVVTKSKHIGPSAQKTRLRMTSSMKTEMLRNLSLESWAIPADVKEVGGAFSQHSREILVEAIAETYVALSSGEHVAHQVTEAGAAGSELHHALDDRLAHPASGVEPVGHTGGGFEVGQEICFHAGRVGFRLIC
jgi:hypothetical protein